MLGRASHTVAHRKRLRQILFNTMAKRTGGVARLQEIDEVRFLGHAFAALPKANAQILQDLWVVFETGGQRDGYFVEFGATNGRTNSNTYLLESEYGWTGILAEPNPVWHDDLSRNRDCIIEHCCISARSGERVAFLATDNPELSSLVTFADKDHFASVRKTAPQIEVQTLSLIDLLIRHDAPRRIDYMSVDTEGSELDILKAFDFERYDVRLLSIEHNNTASENGIDSLMRANGYVRRFPEFSQWDAWYVKP
ncbi:FkbM family methyltransferase [Methylobacterium sp. 77]|uniref:FkbM family methyltransferase n=1 Tax=Methylobacterium sp. 77 TaxID=1101192 RepID=UPI0018CAA62C|nr:FkbM family methyltransferase [Methylobacterium sp. 77]